MSGEGGVASAAELCKMRGNSALKAGDLSGAVFHYSEGLKEEGGNAVLLNNRAIALLRLQRFEDALRDAEAAAEADKGYVKAHTTRGDALRSLRRHVEALAAYRRARALCGEDVPTLLADKLEQAERMGGGKGGGEGGREGGVGGGGGVELKGRELVVFGARGVAFVSVLVFALSGLVFSASMGAFAYSVALGVGFGLNVARILVDCAPVTMDAAFAERMARHKATVSAVLALVFLFQPPLLLILVPVLVFEIATFFLTLRHVAPQRLPAAVPALDAIWSAVAPTISGRPDFDSLPQPSKLRTLNTALASMAVQMQLGVAFLLLLRLNLLPLFLLLSTMRFQALFDQDLRNTLVALDYAIKANLQQYLPAAKPTYEKIANFVQSFDPRTQLQQAQQAQGQAQPASGIAGIVQQATQACNIM